MSSTNRSESRKNHKYDYYVTPIEEIILFLKEFFKIETIYNKGYILDPCAGGEEKGDLSIPMSYPDALKSLGYMNLGTIDIRSDSLANLKEDYLKYDVAKDTLDKPKIIITNPPFDISKEIIRKALLDVEDNGFVIMLQRLNFMGGITENKRFWEEVGLPKYIFVHRKRMSFTNNRKTDSIEYAHYVWQKGFNPDFAKLKIIDRCVLEQESVK